MDKIRKNLVIAMKGILYIYIPVLSLLYIIYKLILKKDMVFYLERDFTYIIYILLIGIWAIVSYREKIAEQKTEDFNSLKSLVRTEKWELIEESESKLIVKPKFNFPFRLLIDDKVYIDYSKNKTIIKGPSYYVDNILRDINGKSSSWRKKSENIAAIIIIFSFVYTPISVELGIPWEIEKRRHSSFVENIPLIEIQSSNQIGNSVQNINNQGQGVENEDYIFYVEDGLSLVRVKKDYSDKKYLIEKSSGSNISRLNLSGDWIFYTSGKDLNRIKIDGSDDRTIYKSSYALDLHLQGNSLYFINIFDNSNVYKIDLNGRNLKRFLEVNASDIALYDNRIIVSIYDESKPYVKSISLEGTNRKILFEDFSRDLVKWDDYYYFIGEDSRLCRIDMEESKTPEILVDKKLSSYIITEDGIFYSLHAEDVGYPGEGIYKINLDGSGKTLILDEEMVEGFTKLGDYVIFHSADHSYESKIKKLNIFTNEIELID